VKNASLPLAAVLLLGAAAAQSGELPANEWVKLEEGGLGQRHGTTLVYVPELKRILAAMGAQARFDRKPTPPYSEMTFNMKKRQWENALPEAGKSWGKLTGPVNAPTFGYGSGLRKGKDGLLRPDLRGGYGLQVYHLAAYDSDRKKLLYGVDMEYDPVGRAWKKLVTKGHPGAPDLPPFDLEKSTVMPAWSQSCYDPVNKEILLFGGAKVVTETGSPGTWAYSPEKSAWRKLKFGTEKLNKLAAKARSLQRKAHAVVTACRNRYYRTELAENAKKKLSAVLTGILKAEEIKSLADELREVGVKAKGYEKVQMGRAFNRITSVWKCYKSFPEHVEFDLNANKIRVAGVLEGDLESAAIALSAEPPPRCYSPMVFDPGTKKIVMFGGYALDRSLADTWLYDPKTRSWEERRPAVSPAPRLGHGLLHLPKSKRIVLVGGWQARCTVGCNVFYGKTLPPEAWTYDVNANKWMLVKRWEIKPAGKRAPVPFPSPGNSPQVFACDENDVVLTLAASGRKGPNTWACRLDPSVTDAAGTAKFGAGPGAVHSAGQQCLPWWWDATNPEPDLEGVGRELKALPVNKWVRRSTGKLNRMTFAYSSVTFDPDRDQIIVWAGGHGTYHGTDVTRYSLATDRWHTDYPAQLPLTFGYFATGGTYAYGFRPWMGVHPWGGYAYDTVSRKMISLTGMRIFTFVFDPDAGDYQRPWVKLPPGGGGWATTACTTPGGVCMWTRARGRPGALYRLDVERKAWVQLPTQKGAPTKMLAHAGPDASGLTYDSERKRLVLLAKGFKGDVVTYDLEKGDLKQHAPANKEMVAKLGFCREFEYAPGADLVMDPTGNAWDPKKNEWLRLKLDLSAAYKPRRKQKGPALSANNSQGLAYDPKRDLLWLVNGYQNKGVFVLKLDAAKARK